MGDLHRLLSLASGRLLPGPQNRPVKRIGFLSFGHWTSSPHSSTQSGADALLQSIELAVAAEEVGADGPMSEGILQRHF